MAPGDDPVGQPFPTTRWSVVLATGQPDEQRHRALEELCAIYWPVVYAFLRQHGHDADDAKDLTQGLFLHLLEREDYRTADPEKGRFRSYLRTCARNFAASQHRHEQAEKRGGKATHLAISFEDHDRVIDHVPIDTVTPEQAFDRQYAQQLVNVVLERLGDEMRTRGRGEQFEVLRGYLEACEGATYQEAGAQLGMREGAVKVAVHRMRERYREMLIEEVRQTLADPDDAADEIDQLLAALAFR
jgi:RNA polymerase sigma factor (sigma-70 family)